MDHWYGSAFNQIYTTMIKYGKRLLRTEAVDVVLDIANYWIYWKEGRSVVMGTSTIRPFMDVADFISMGSQPQILSTVDYFARIRLVTLCSHAVKYEGYRT